MEAVQAGLEAGVDAADESGRQIQVGQLITAMRHADRGQEIAELAVRHRTRGAVGFDIAGAEDGFLPSRFKDAFTYLAANNFPATVHAGEAAGLESIQSALVDGRALRLGHGVRIAEDITVEFEDNADDDGEGTVGLVTLGNVAGWVRDRGIPLEICPSSNLQTGAIANFGEGIESHPLDMLFQLGFNVTINTDNRLGVGVGGYHGQAALSVGYSRQLSPRANVTFGGAVSGNETSGGVGVGCPEGHPAPESPTERTTSQRFFTASPLP